ncbi:hypothetical protein BWQ96_01895 [Gracilariopsis chorda]|uniref:Uncharacterized protein n=1 Tax=Gracilariopsis chorda TaxID=448386 RepID=A0A2V3J242_9FLOR|nr:hypothetical protein BWQ96_01895 [Gracilariopsis chorda]|eukprot:PXF48435.1 hypothetical protein BWQ96_01895 [Gracilariopsis chorda]
MSATRRLLRTVCSKAISGSPAAGNKPISAHDLIQESHVQALLSKSSLSSSQEILDATVKMDILKHYALKYRIPVASSAFSTMRSAQDIAEWYSTQLHPRGPQSHGDHIVLNMIKSGEKENMPEDQIDLASAKQRAEVLESLPQNLRLDERAFRRPQFSLKGKKKRTPT